MAVTKIRKISSWTLLICSLITVVVLGLFFFGGVNNPGEEQKDYVYTSLLLNWTYIICGLTIVATLVFAAWQLITAFRTDAKGALIGIGAIVLFAAVLGVTYLIGDPTALEGLNIDSQKFNTEGWLKVTDMWIYSSYILIGLIVLAVIAGSVKRILNK